MNLIRHILSHLLLFFVLMVIGLSYYFRPVIFPTAVNDKINTLVGSVYAPALKVVYVVPKQKEIVAEATVQSMAKTELAPEVVVQDIIKQEPQAVSPAVTAKTVVAETELNRQQQVDLPSDKVVTPPVAVVQQQIVNEIEKTETTDTSSSPGDAVKEDVTSLVTDRDTSAEKNLLADARLAYQNKDLEAAIRKYRQLIVLDEHSPNAFGELGNIYYSQGKWQEAGAAYYEAAVRLVENGQMQQVVYLHRVIQGLDRSKAEQLTLKLNHGHM